MFKTPAGRLLLGAVVLLLIGGLAMAILGGRKPPPKKEDKKEEPVVLPQNPFEISKLSPADLGKLAKAIKSDSAFASQLSPNHWEQGFLALWAMIEKAEAEAKKAKEATVKTGGVKFPEPVSLFVSNLTCLFALWYWMKAVLPLNLPSRDMTFVVGSGFGWLTIGFLADSIFEAFGKKDAKTGVTLLVVLAGVGIGMFAALRMEVFPAQVSGSMPLLWVVAAFSGVGMQNFFERLAQYLFPPAKPAAAKK